MPTIVNISKKHYHCISKDNSIDYEDILQKNKILAWVEIQRIQKKIKLGEINEKLPFGFFLKNKLAGYNRARLQKKENICSRVVCSLDSMILDRDNKKPMERYKLDPIIYFPDFTKDVETKYLYEKFIKQLTEKEKEFLQYLEMYKSSCHKISKKTKFKLQVCNKLKRKLKKDFIEFLVKEGYKI